MMQSSESGIPHQVVFYTKAGCHLCDDARDLLEELAAEFPFELTEIDIRSDLSLFETYRHRIPVMLIDGQQIVEGRISQADLRRALTKR